MNRTPLVRKTPLKSKSWGFSDSPRTPLNPVNVRATAKRVARRAKDRHSAENKEAKALAWARADGVCECGCGLEFDKTFPDSPDYPEAHHVKYTPPIIQYLRRGCHRRIEMMNFGHRRHGKLGK